MPRVPAVIVRSFVLTLLVALALGGLVNQRVAAQDAGAGTLTVTVSFYDFTEPEGFPDDSGLSAPYNYGQNLPAQQSGLTPAAPQRHTILVFAETGGKLGEGTTDDASPVTIEITAGIPFFIIDGEDTGAGSYVVTGEIDESWNEIHNLTAAGVADSSDAPGQGDGPGGATLAQLEIATYACPAGYVAPEADPINSATASCVDPLPGVDVSVRPRVAEAQPTVLTTGDSGYAAAGLPASDLGYDLVLTLPDRALGYIVNCTRVDGNDPGVVYTVAGFQVQSATVTGDEVGCDVFFVFGGAGDGSAQPSAVTSPAPSAVSSTGTSSPTGNSNANGTSGTVVGLPNTGTGASGSAPVLLWSVLVLVVLLFAAMSGFALRRPAR